MSDKRNYIKIAFVLLLSFSLLTFLYLYNENEYIVEEVEGSEVSLKDWSIDSSVLNGLPLEENKNIYKGQDPSKMESIYITVYPTEDSEGKLLDFSVFDLHTARNKDFNPLLNVNVQFGDVNGELGEMVNLDQINGSIQVRGNSARGAEYKSYKIKLSDDEDTFYGQKTLNLNKHMGDVSKIANKFAMDILATVDNISSFRTSFMKVYIRDASDESEGNEFKYYGLYTHVEQPNKTYLTSRGLDENGSMYKASNFEFRLRPQLKNIDDPTYSEEEFETVLGIREAKDHSKLIKMLEDINNLSLDFNEIFYKYFNEENYLTWVGSNILLGNEDVIAHNYLIYNPKNSLTWYLLPWDYDGTFRFGEYSSSYTAPINLKGIQRMSGVLLHRRYFKQDGNLEKLEIKMKELLNNQFTEEKVTTLINQYKPVLEQTMDIYPDVLITEIPPNELEDYIDQFYLEIRKNYQNFIDSLEYPAPFFVSEPELTSNGHHKFAWETSHDYQGDLVTYRIALAYDKDMTNLIFDQEILNTEYVHTSKLRKGTYYLKITATDEKGNTQFSLDSYFDEANSDFRFGLRQVIIE